MAPKRRSWHEVEPGTHEGDMRSYFCKWRDAASQGSLVTLEELSVKEAQRLSRRPEAQ